MKGVSFTREPREGQEEFDKIDVRTYAQRVFSMYSGKKKRVTIRFINMLLDVAVERFGTKDAQYSAVDDKHFTVTAEVEISDLFSSGAPPPITDPPTPKHVKPRIGTRCF